MTETITLQPHTSIIDLLRCDQVISYHSSSSRELVVERGLHVGSKKQALIRADLMVNDNEEYDEYFLHEVVFVFRKPYPAFLEDTGEFHDKALFDEIDLNYHVGIYKNLGEGNKNDNNFSVVILNTDVIIKTRLIRRLTKERLLKNQSKLYA